MNYDRRPMQSSPRNLFVINVHSALWSPFGELASNVTASFAGPLFGDGDPTICWISREIAPNATAGQSGRTERWRSGVRIDSEQRTARMSALATRTQISLHDLYCADICKQKTFFNLSKSIFNYYVNSAKSGDLIQTPGCTLSLSI